MNHTIIRLENISKNYKLYAHDFDRIREILTGKPCHLEQAALQNVSLQVKEGEVIGVVGRNGAGKSTLLKILADTLQPTTGTLEVRGRVAALLELGASFHPEMSGHDNIYLNCSIQGLSRKETDAVYEDIVEFSGIREFIQRPVKTYSSGMFIRLAFAIATHIDPDILIIDEALSVGDGIFARRSFDRIMSFKRAGKTIFFCSHSMYQVESLCDRVIWIDQGKVQQDGNPATVITHYTEFLSRYSPQQEVLEDENEPETTKEADKRIAGEIPRFLKIEVQVDGKSGKSHQLKSCQGSLDIDIVFYAGKDLPTPSLGLVIRGGDGRIVTSVGTVNDGITLHADEAGKVHAKVIYPALALLKGNYGIDAYLMCEQGLHVYEAVRQIAELHVEQSGLARGIVDLPHRWE